MTLITRVSRLFRADVNEVLDRIEEPDVLLRQAIRDMESELEADIRRRQLLEREIEQIGARERELEATLNEIEDELDLCFASGKDDLVRMLVRRKLESQRYMQFLERRRRALSRDQAALAKRIDDNRQRLETMRQKAEVLADADRNSGDGEPWHGTGFDSRFTVSDKDVEVALLREQRERTRS